ncbi:hypothetical protein Hanom_Chr01g00019221 [Helianthus anomalus]
MLLIREIMGGESGSSQPPNEAAVFQNVLGDRRGWFRGLGPKPSNTPSNPFSAQPQTAQPFSEVNYTYFTIFGLLYKTSFKVV